MGNSITCPTGHAVLSIDFPPYTSNWSCNRCEKKFTSNDGMWRCCKECDFDYCHSCAEAVEFKPNHEHTLAYVNYICSECQEANMGSRVYCPTCIIDYDACYRCVLRKMMEMDTSSDGKVKSISINTTPFALGANRDAFKIEATLKDGKFNIF